MYLFLFSSTWHRFNMKICLLFTAVLELLPVHIYRNILKKFYSNCHCLTLGSKSSCTKYSSHKFEFGKSWREQFGSCWYKRFWKGLNSVTKCNRPEGLVNVKIINIQKDRNQGRKGNQFIILIFASVFLMPLTQVIFLFQSSMFLISTLAG